MGAAGSMKGLRRAVFVCSWSMAQSETGGTQRHQCSRRHKIRVQPWSDTVAELLAGLWAQTEDWESAAREHSSQSVMQSGRLSVSILAGFRLGGAQANPEASCLALVRNYL